MPDPILQPYQPLWSQLGRARKFVQLAGVFGALAVILAAYGAHGHDLHGKSAGFHTAVQIQFFHTLALLAVPFVRRPDLTGYLLIIGQILFCGPNYFAAFSGETTFARLPPAGGITLIAAWLSMAL